METAFAEMPLVLFTTLCSMGAGAFIALACVVFVGKFSDDELESLDKTTIIPAIVVLIGFICSFFHLASPLNSFGVLAGVGASPLSNEICAGIVFVVLLLVYVIMGLMGKLSGGLRKGLLALTAVLAAVFVVFMGLAYMMETIPSWNTPATLVQIIGCALVGGAALAAMQVALVGAMKSASQSSAKVCLMVLAVLGAVMAIAGTFMITSTTGAMFNPLYSGADLATAANGAQIAALLLVALAAAATVIAAMDKNPIPMSALAVALALAGIIFARLVFYAMQLSVGISAL